VQLFDLKTFRPLYTYSIDSDVNSLAFHKHSMIFACGCGDRMARLFPLNSPSLTCSTKPEAMPVVSTCFYGKGFLFTAASESLKLWDVRNGGCFMTDNIENTPKGILDLVVTETQTQVIAYAGGVLSLSTCRLDSMSFKGEYTHVYNPKK
jgi:WD40 repeat protein